MIHTTDLTNRRWSQPLAAVKSTFDGMKQVPMFATLAPASGTENLVSPRISAFGPQRAAKSGPSAPVNATVPYRKLRCRCLGVARVSDGALPSSGREFICGAVSRPAS